MRPARFLLNGKACGLAAVDRRTLCRGAIMACASLAGLLPASAQRIPGSDPRSARFAFTGCRTTRERNARGEGINVFRIQPATASWEHVQLLQGLPNPSFLACDRTGRFLYAVHGDLGDVSAYVIDNETGRISPINQQSTGGRNPVHLLVDTTNRFLVIANYATGSVAVLPIRPDGGLDPLVQLVTLEGQGGPHAKEQASSHPHEIAYDRAGSVLMVPDKGVDRIFAFAFDSAKGALVRAEPAFVATRPGAGPRHIVYAPSGRLAYVNYELDSSVATYRVDPAKGSLFPIQVIPSTPDTFTGENTSSEIDCSADGRFIYVSNRGHDSIGVFATDPASGRLSPVEWVSSRGKGPRFMAIEPTGRFLYAANENSDTIVAFRIDRDSGRLSPSGDVVRTGSPTCIAFL